VVFVILLETFKKFSTKIVQFVRKDSLAAARFHYTETKAQKSSFFGGLKILKAQNF